MKDKDKKSSQVAKKSGTRKANLTGPPTLRLSGHTLSPSGCSGHMPLQEPVAGCQFCSGHFLLSTLQKIILFHCCSHKIHCIRWCLQVASVCILAYRSVGFYC